MKVETTITIEADLLEQVKSAAKNFRSSSEVFERALREYLPKLNQKTPKRKLTREEEIELMNRYADEHREEILETLSYQIDLGKEANFIGLKNRRSAIRRGFVCLSSLAAKDLSKLVLNRSSALRFIQPSLVCRQKLRSALTKA